jgi:predicted TIM-barrel fold metal-dependent hydrolase
MLIIDAHCHTSDNWEEPIETLLYQMQANGVSGAVLAQLNGHYDNTYILDCVRRHEGKFKAVVIVDPQDRDRTGTLESLRKQGAAGVRINLRREKEWSPDDPVLKLAGELGMIVSAIGNAENFASARFKKLLDNCPGTRFCLERLARSAHPGVDYATPPHDGYRAALECARWPNTTVKVPGIGEIVDRPSRFPPGSASPLVNVPPLYDMAKEAFGARRMMWASNFPPCSHKEGYRNALRWVRDYPGFRNGDDLEWIMGKSAAKLWGFAA